MSLTLYLCYLPCILSAIAHRSKGSAATQGREAKPALLSYYDARGAEWV